MTKRANSYFLNNLDERSSLAAIRCLQDWTAKSITGDIRSLFRSLALVLSELFEAQLVTVWDNNNDNNCLVLQASNPERDSSLASHTISAETSSTGLTVRSRDVVCHEDILHPGESRCFTNPGIVKELKLVRMVSVPVFNAARESVKLVLNICFDSEHGKEFPISIDDLRRFASDLGRSLQYLVYERDQQIITRVRVSAATATGIPGLFDALSETLSDVALRAQATLFLWNSAKESLTVEGSTDLQRDPLGKALVKNLPKMGEDDVDYQNLFPCVENGRPLSLRNVFEIGHQETALESAACTYMAVPVVSANNRVLGVVRCRNPITESGNPLSFSSLDLRALQTLSSAITPSIERFLRLREGIGPLKVVRDVSNEMVQAYQLDTSLQRTIETLVRVMHSRFGCIYLRQEGTDTLLMRAATEPSKSLVGKAIYKVGEGITGAIAQGELLNFRTKEELRSYPKWLGKYHSDVWGVDCTDDSETLLGVPIIAGEQVIGVWKVENVQSTKAHPDPYYTDEDVQVVQVLSSLLAYAIQNYKQEERRLRQFTSLARTIQIQNAPDEKEAISSVLIALEEAGFAGALLSLYDSQTKLIAATLSSGPFWTGISAIPKCHLDDNEIRAVVLKTNHELFIMDPGSDARCKNTTPKKSKVSAEYILPLRVEEELIGTLQVDIGNRKRLLEDEELILKAFASHLAIAISRKRSVQQALDLTNQIMVSSRFVVAETLSGMAVHSLHHKLRDITNRLSKDLKRREIRENEFMLKTFRQWNSDLGDLEDELKKVLHFIRAPVNEHTFDLLDIHPQIQLSITTWFNYIRNNNCGITTTLEGSSSTCDMSPEAFREIMAVLIVNAVQAHAKHIDISTYNDSAVKTSAGKIIESAICLECSDDGNGIATNEPEKLFDATYTTKPKNLGTGLGLFVARRLARNGGGDLEVILGSRQSKGATFRLSLPITE